MRKANTWGVAALAAGALLLTMVAGPFATPAVAALVQDQQGRPPQPPPGGPDGPGGPGGPGGGVERMLFDLDLTSAQMEQVETLHEEFQTASKTYQDQVRKAEESIRAAIQADTFDEEAVRTLATSLASASSELRVLQAKRDAAIWKLLTTEQKAELSERMQRGPKGGPRG